MAGPPGTTTPGRSGQSKSYHAVTHADGQPGNFKVYEQYHRELRRHDGNYVFAVYKVRDGSFNPFRLTLVHSKPPRLSWHGGGDHRGTGQAKLSIGDVFLSILVPEIK